jgi:hypothetical protein
VAWRKRNDLRRIETQINYGPRKRLTVTGRKTTSRATVAWHSENVVRKDCASDQAEQGTPKQRKDGEGLWKYPECNNGKMDQGIKQKLHSRMRTKDLADRLPLCPRNERTFSWTYRKTIESMKIAQQVAEIWRKTRRLEVAKRTARSTVDMQKMNDWTLWRGRAPPKRKKKLQIRSKSRANVGAPATPGVTAHTVVCEREREKKNLHDCERTKPLDDCDN